MSKILKFFDRISISSILGVWIGFGVLMGLLFYLISYYSPENGLLYFQKPMLMNLRGLFSCVYFSFVTITSTGYGDITPSGISQYITVLEILSGIVLLGTLISKLVSSKQERLTEEIYELSFEEKVNRLKTSLYISRANVHRIMDRINASLVIRRADIADFEASMISLSENLVRVHAFVSQQSKKKAVSETGPFTANILLNSIQLSLVRLIEFLSLLDSRKFEWKGNKNITSPLRHCLDSARAILRVYGRESLSEEGKTLFRNVSSNAENLEKMI